MINNKLVLCFQSCRHTWTCATTYYFDFEKGIVAYSKSSRSGWQEHDDFRLALNFGEGENHSSHAAALIQDLFHHANVLKKFSSPRPILHTWLSKAITNGKLPKTIELDYIGWMTRSPERDILLEHSVPVGTSIRFTPIKVNFWTKTLNTSLTRKEPDPLETKIANLFKTSGRISLEGGIQNSSAVRVLCDVEEAKRIVTEVWEQMSDSQYLLVKEDSSHYRRKDIKSRSDLFKFLKDAGLYDTAIRYDVAKYYDIRNTFEQLTSTLLAEKRKKKKPTKNEITKAVARHLKLHPKTHKLFKLLAFADVITKTHHQHAPRSIHYSNSTT